MVAFTTKEVHMNRKTVWSFPRSLPWIALLAFVWLPLVPAHAKGKTQGAGDPKVLVERYIEEIWNQGRFGSAGALVTSDYRGQTRAAGQPLASGPAGLEKWAGGLRALFPDGKRTVRSLTVEGDRVAAEVQFTGTHGTTGRRVSAEQVHVFQIRDGRIAEESIYFDVGGLLRQLQP
jgi:steroid delta-isomerase-like uncharacterized protein